MRARQLLRSLEDVVIDVERGSHEAIITHHASDVNAPKGHATPGAPPATAPDQEPRGYLGSL